jgi:hypothetical protein
MPAIAGMMTKAISSILSQEALYNILQKLERSIRLIVSLSISLQEDFDLSYRTPMGVPAMTMQLRNHFSAV